MLDLAGNALTQLPDDLPRLGRLRILFCSGSPFEALPEVLGACPRLEMIGFRGCGIHTVPEAALPAGLRWLILTENRIEALPAAIGRCSRLQKLALAGNRLASLPPEMAGCTGLELVRIAANRLDALPGWLPALPRLAWLAYAGNPFCAAVEADRQREGRSHPFAWDALEIGEVLGQGASGVIHRALWHDGGERREVAVKLFKGAVTSDGLPEDEMAACLGAGAHLSLIPILGRLAGHPEGRDGLVMALVEPAFRSLAGPPSLASCTRDVYAPGTRLGAAQALGIARGIASAARQLHARGINHGDLYAHNILYHPDGRVLLGDFGAASFVPPGASRLAAALERVELRAFGCLLEELAERCPPDPGAALGALARRCQAPEPARRPSFVEVEEALARLAA
ncbi:leucine-rich repeat-containing protein kinase family protein [Zoogloea sp.]|uniref:leucine-rich repeat-containing protein kinase family protein n=1 Tax=Zoogloea sp. TaxID=49181 RepID=UPI0035B20B63